MNQTYLDTPEWPLLGIAHVKDLPGIRWKLYNLQQLRDSDAKKFEKQAQLLATQLSVVS